jgi:tetratricopeptide (TPR) repeat protein
MTVARPPICFVLMPFGKKADARGTKVDFDAVYDLLIAPAVRDAGLEPLRADQEITGGLVHKPMFERLILADFAVGDLTTANANVFYELGVRHAVRPYSTVLIAADVKGLPFDVVADRVLPYSVERGVPSAIDGDSANLTEQLEAARDAVCDSPVFQLVDDLPVPQIDRLKTDVFRDEAAYSAEAKQRLAQARGEGVDALRKVEKSLGAPENVEAGVLVDLYLSYRALKAWDHMIALAERMPKPLSSTVLVREQLGFALNRAGRSKEAQDALEEVLDKHGPSSETYGLLGRVYKDRWDAERGRNASAARGYLKQAIRTYKAGFEADWRDAYPGVNAVTLLEIFDPGGEEQKRLVPVVRYAVERRIAAGKPDYWDHATLLSLAIIGRDRDAAEEALADALAAVRETWEPETTANDVRLIREARAEQGEELDWATEVERRLDAAASPR